MTALFPSRDVTWRQLRGPAWDVIVVGGGITGAAVLREAARRGRRGLLIEQRDFAWGTSSRSSRMVHGGLRYIAQGDFKLMRDAVRERERLLRDAPGLVEPLRYLFPHRAGKSPGRYAMAALLKLYNIYARRDDQGFMDAEQLRWHAPYLAEGALTGASYYTDAVTDDARLVLRLLQEAQQEGAVAANYVAAEALLQDDHGVAGVRVRDVVSGATAELHARCVINATGAWADRLRLTLVNERRIRPLRGSHLVFPAWRLPVFECITVLHPRDRRPIFVYPWEGATIVGTTDLDHDRELDEEPQMYASELEYLLEVTNAEFPSLQLTSADVIASFAGVRPVIGTGRHPSRERRDHAVWNDRGLITVTGGKLTTCRLIALDALRAAGLAKHRALANAPIFRAVEAKAPRRVTAQQWRRLCGRYGVAAADVLTSALHGELERVPGTPTLWAELRWAARSEAVVHLDDLLLRRTRLGLLLPAGGAEHWQKIRAICQPELRWDDARWTAETDAYAALWRRCYSVPGGTLGQDRG